MSATTRWRTRIVLARPHGNEPPLLCATTVAFVGIGYLRDATKLAERDVERIPRILDFTVAHGVLSATFRRCSELSCVPTTRFRLSIGVLRNYLTNHLAKFLLRAESRSSQATTRHERCGNSVILGPSARTKLACLYECCKRRDAFRRINVRHAVIERIPGVVFTPRPLDFPAGLGEPLVTIEHETRLRRTHSRLLLVCTEEILAEGDRFLADHDG